MSNRWAESASKRAIIQHSCLQCSKAFRAIRKARYCSNRCRQKAKHDRSKS